MSVQSNYVLGVSAFFHDSAACLLKNGEIIAACQEERFTRIKHDPSFPTQSIKWCLYKAGISIQDIKAVCFYEKPFIKFERLLLTYMSYAPRGLKSFLKAMPVWLKEKLFIKTLIQDELKFNGPIYFSSHHLSHAASAFYPSPFTQAAIITCDGVGEWATTSWGIGSGNSIEIKEEMHFPHSIGLLYSAFTYFLGFTVNSGEYKVMGLAPYGKPKYEDIFYQFLLDVKDDGSFSLNMDYFSYPYALTMTNDKIERLFGFSRRLPESPLEAHHADLAASLQKVTQDILLKMVNHVYQQTGLDSLCLAGGVALNCVANGLISQQSAFKKVWIQPAASDAGGALGAAYYIWHEVLKNERNINHDDDFQRGSFLGPKPLDLSEATFEDLAQQGHWVYHLLPEHTWSQTIAKLLNEGNTIAICQGAMEFGPRALGHRSIIADPRNLNMQKQLNLKVKFRESFRPFAPAVLEEHASQYFELKQSSPYMLLVARVKEEFIERVDQEKSLSITDQINLKRSPWPAITHVDYSARVQTVNADNNPFFYKILHSFYQLTGCPMLINTSFNIRGEPIVCFADDAYRCFMCTELDYLIIDRYLIKRLEQPQANILHRSQITQILD